LPRGRAGLAEQLLELLLALGRQLVDDLGATGRAAGVRVRVALDDPAPGHQGLQAGVEGAVGQGAERPEQRVQPLAQLVPVQGALVQEAEDGEVERTAATAHAGLPRSGDAPMRCIAAIYLGRPYVTFGRSPSVPVGWSDVPSPAARDRRCPVVRRLRTR